MRHWLIVLLLVVVPLQLAWAGAAVYCGHEPAAAGAKHVGHHEHAHQPGSEDPLAAADNAEVSAAVHADCETCHFGASATLTNALLGGTVPCGAGLVVQSSPPYRSHTPAAPERPDRSLALLSRDATAALRSDR